MNFRTIIVGSLVLCAIAPWFIHGISWWKIIISDLDHCNQLACDFTKHYMPQVKLLNKASNNFATGWFYPPLLAILLLPLHDSQNPVLWWYVLNAGALVGLAWLCARMINQKPQTKHWIVGFALVLSSLPVLHSLKWGQVSLMIGFLSCFALLSLRFLGGNILGFVAALKGYPALYAILPFMCRRGQSLLWFGLAFVFWAFAFPVGILDLDGLELYYTNMLNGGQKAQAIAAKFGGQALLPSFKRWFADGSHGFLAGSNPRLYPLGASLTIVGFWVTAGLLSIGSLLALRKEQLPHPLKVVIILCSIGLLLSPGWHHYFVFLPFCMVALWMATERITTRFVVVIAFLIQQIPILLLGHRKLIYYEYSAYGGTTIAALLILLATLELSLRMAVKTE